MIQAPELLTSAHDCSEFTCAHQTLSEWLRKRALANQVSGASKTYVVTEERARVVGFYGLAAGAVAVTRAPGRLRRNMPDPIPVIVLGRLAVHSTWAGKGLGTGLLKDALLRSHQAAQIIGAKALICHAIDATAKEFYLKHGFHEFPLEPLTLFIGLDFGPP